MAPETGVPKISQCNLFTRVVQFEFRSLSHLCLFVTGWFKFGLPRGPQCSQPLTPSPFPLCSLTDRTGLLVRSGFPRSAFDIFSCHFKSVLLIGLCL